MMGLEIFMMLDCRKDAVNLLVCYAEIYPLLIQQESLNKKLVEIKEEVQNLKSTVDELLVRLQIILSQAKHDYNEEKIERLEKIKNTLLAIKKQNNRRHRIKKKGELIGESLLGIQRGFRHLVKILEPVGPITNVATSDEDFQSKEISAFQQYKEKEVLEIEPELKKLPDPITMIPLIASKLKILAENYMRKPYLEKKAELFYQKKNQFIYEQKELKSDDVDLLEGIQFPDRYMKTRSTLHLESDKYVKENKVDELALVAASVKARRRPGLKYWKLERQRLRRWKKHKCPLVPSRIICT